MRECATRRALSDPGEIGRTLDGRELTTTALNAVRGSGSTAKTPKRQKRESWGWVRRNRLNISVGEAHTGFMYRRRATSLRGTPASSFTDVAATGCKLIHRRRRDWVQALSLATLMGPPRRQDHGARRRARTTDTRMHEVTVRVELTGGRGSARRPSFRLLSASAVSLGECVVFGLEPLAGGRWCRCSA